MEIQEMTPEALKLFELMRDGCKGQKFGDIIIAISALLALVHYLSPAETKLTKFELIGMVMEKLHEARIEAVK